MTAAKQLTAGNQVIELLSLSRDRKWLVFDSDLCGNPDIYRMPVSGGIIERLTNDFPSMRLDLSPNDNEIAWHKWINGARQLFVKRIDSDSCHRNHFRWNGPGCATLVSPTGPRSPRGVTTRNGEGSLPFRRSAGGEWGKVSWLLDRGQLPICRRTAAILLCAARRKHSDRSRRFGRGSNSLSSTREDERPGGNFPAMELRPRVDMDDGNRAEWPRRDMVPFTSVADAPPSSV